MVQDPGETPADSAKIKGLSETLESAEVIFLADRSQSAPLRGARPHTNMHVDCICACPPPSADQTPQAELNAHIIKLRESYSMLGMDSATAVAQDTYILVSYGVGLHCVQPEPYWRIR